MEPKFNELGEKLKDVKDIVIAKMDATANDGSPAFKVEGWVDDDDNDNGSDDNYDDDNYDDEDCDYDNDKYLDANDYVVFDDNDNSDNCHDCDDDNDNGNDDGNDDNYDDDNDNNYDDDDCDMIIRMALMIMMVKC